MPTTLDDIPILIDALNEIEFYHLEIKTNYSEEVSIAIDENLPTKKVRLILVEKIG
jgi:hypothetical protein